jgi:Tol biopolymer transport system component
MNLGPTVNSSAFDAWPEISADGLSLFFHSNRPGGSGGDDIWMARRATKGDNCGAPVNLGAAINSPRDESGPCISTDGLSLYFGSNRPGGYAEYDLWVSTRTTVQEDWNAPVNLGPTVNSLSVALEPSISRDGLALFFSSSVGFGSADLWVTTRPTANAPWGPPTNLGAIVNSPHSESGPSISADSLTLYFCDWAMPQAPRPGGYGLSDLWQVPILPVVDFSGDGKVNGKDVLALANLWGTEDSLCDIGPMPWGDGVVDIED